MRQLQTISRKHESRTVKLMKGVNTFLCKELQGSIAPETST